MNPETPCAKCGFNLGLHRTSDEACPVPGTFINGDETRWRLDSKFEPVDQDPAATCEACGYCFKDHRRDGACPVSESFFVPGSRRYQEDSKFKPVDNFQRLPGSAKIYFREPALASARANLRKVMFQRWATFSERLKAKAERKEGDGEAEPFMIANIHGYFHAWGLGIPVDDLPGTIRTVAIIEAEDGHMYEISPSDLKFLS